MSPRAQGSALPVPATVSHALPETSRTRRPDSAGWGHRDRRLRGAGEGNGSASLGCARCAQVGSLRFQGSGEGVVVTPSSSPEAGGGRGLRSGRGQRLLGCSLAPWEAAVRPDPARERAGGSPGGAGALRVGRPRPAERPRWETPSQRFAPYLPSVRPILFSALKTDMSNWQSVPNRVQRSLVEHFYSCLLQLDAYSCRLNEKQNVL